MRIMALAFPPDLGGDEMQSALDEFMKSMFQLSRFRSSPAGTATPPADPAIKLWEAGRGSMNSFYTALNTATQSSRLVSIPAMGVGYPRSKKLYTQLKKDAAMCQNRGGEALAGIWGQLMVYGTASNPCGTVSLATYFSQGQA